VIDPGSLAVLAALFLVGGWGLGRDVDLSERADRLGTELERRAIEAQQAQLEAQQAQLEAQQAQLQAQRAQLEAQQAQIEAQRAALVAQQNALLAQRAQLEPHFLFNVLNAIAEHCRHDPEVAERSLLSLASLLRTMLDATRAPSWPLRTELELVRAVTELYAVRDRSRYRFRLSWPALDDVVLPPLLLLPMIENAVTHGPAADHEGEVCLEVTREDELVEIRIENPGPFDGPREGGEGLAMIRRRLALAFGEAASFSIEASAGDATGPRTRAIVRLPVAGPMEAA
jgi:LytS/YehU family sensor histidine kinase